MFNNFKQKIIYSNFRDFFIFSRLIIKKIIPIKYLWKHKFQKQNKKEESILLFLPSLSIDKPNFLNVGLRSFIEASKKKDIVCDLILCNAGLEICHLGGGPFNSNSKMPCKTCYKVNKSLFKDLNIIEFNNINLDHKKKLEKLSFDELKNYKYRDYELGRLVTPSIIWILRDSRLNEKHKSYFVKFINSGIKFINYIENLDIKKYSSVVLFNGVVFPESLLFEYCKKNKIQIATFESGFNLEDKPSIEFNYNYTSKHTFTSAEDELTTNQKNMVLKRLDSFGDKAESDITNIIDEHLQNIVIFGNVSWDASQYISSSIFNSMFEWLDELTNILIKFPDYKYIFKTHPGENRNIKRTWYGLAEWYEKNNINKKINSEIIFSNQNINSNKLIKKSSLSLVYNSTVGMESAILGVKSMMAATTHYSYEGFVNHYDSKSEYLKNLELILKNKDFKLSDEKIKDATKYYYQLFNNVSYDLNKITNLTSKYEHTISSYENFLQFISENELRNVPKNIINNKNLEKMYNLS